MINTAHTTDLSHRKAGGIPFSEQLLALPTK